MARISVLSKFPSDALDVLLNGAKVESLSDKAYSCVSVEPGKYQVDKETSWYTGPGELLQPIEISQYRKIHPGSLPSPPLVPKLQLGNPLREAPASRDGKLELPRRRSQAGAWEPAGKVTFVVLRYLFEIALFTCLPLTLDFLRPLPNQKNLFFANAEGN